MDTQSTEQHSEPPASRVYAPGYLWAADQAVNHHQALQAEGELAVVLSLLHCTDPHVILEIGTWAGGSAWAWSRIPTVQHIVTVDLGPREEAAVRLAELPCRADLVVGDSGHPDTVRRVTTFLDGYAPDVLVIDGAHEYTRARRDWDTYMPMVKAGGLVILHDTQGYPGNDTVQVPQLWAEVRGSYRSAEVVTTPGGPAGTGIVWL